MWRASALFLALLVASPGGAAPKPDYYPEIRAMILEAIDASSGIRLLPDGSNPWYRAAQLLARAGYLEDALRIGAKVEPTPNFGAERTLYGDLEGALQAASSFRGLHEKTAYLNRLATVLWRMGDKSAAGNVLDEAARIARTIPNPAHRRNQLRLIAEKKALLPDDPPIPISPEPRPSARQPRTSVIPAFPITVDGFRDKSADETAKNAQANEAYLVRLYALVAARDSDGLRRHTESAAQPFQKAIGYATLEHLLIQVGGLMEAESSAKSIPDDGADCTVAKAEALTAAGRAWAAIGQLTRAESAFDAAKEQLASIAGGFAFAKAVITASIAAAEARAGMAGASLDTFQKALELAAVVEPRPKSVKGVYPKGYARRDFRDDAYRRIFEIAIEANDLAIARKTAGLWREAEGPRVESSIATAWLRAGRKQEAIAYAHGLALPIDRVPALLSLAQDLLEEAGAPSP